MWDDTYKVTYFSKNITLFYDENEIYTIHLL